MVCRLCSFKMQAACEFMPMSKLCAKHIISPRKCYRFSGLVTDYHLAEKNIIGQDYSVTTPIWRLATNFEIVFSAV